MTRSRGYASIRSPSTGRKRTIRPSADSTGPSALCTTETPNGLAASRSMSASPNRLSRMSSVAPTSAVRLRQVVVQHRPGNERGAGAPEEAPKRLHDGKAEDGSLRVRPKLDRARPGPALGDVDVREPARRQLADCRRSVDVRDDLV